MKKPRNAINYDGLRLQAFDNAAQANIISTVASGKIIIANSAACKLLGYSGKELLSKSTSDIFNTNNKSFLKKLRQRKAGGHSTALVIAIKKNGNPFPAEITYSVFTGEDRVKEAIITFSDRSQSILDQTGIDDKKERIVAANIVLAVSKQKKIDTKNKRIVAGNIVLAESKQKRIDTINEKIVAGNIVLAESKQKRIDTINEKIVAGNIVLAESRQKRIDTKNEKIVAGNIVLAKSKQKRIDTRNEKIVAGNIVLAKSKQKRIDTRNEKIVASNIVLAKSKQDRIDTKKEKIVADNIVIAKTRQEEIYKVLARKKKEESEKRYRQIVETSQEGIWMIDENEKTTFVNKKMCEILEYTEREMMGQDIYFFMDEEGKQSAKKSMLVKKEREAGQSNFRYNSKSGKEIWTNISTTPLFNKNGSYKGSLAMVTDITESKKAEQQKEFERRDKEALINTTEDLIWSISNDFTLIAANHAFFSMLKKSMGVNVKPGDKLISVGLFPTDILTLWEDLYNKAIAGNSFIKEIYTPAGDSYAETWAEARFNPIYDGDVITGIACYSRDITGFKNYQNNLVHINKKLETAQQIAQIGYWEFGMDMSTLYCSDEVYKIWGVSPGTSEANYKEFYNNIHPDDREFFDAIQIPAFKGENKLDVEHRIILPDGTIKHVHERGELVYNDEGVPIYFEGTVQDITERKNAEFKLKENELRYRSLIEQATDSICITDSLFRFIDINPCACRMFGYSKDEALKLSLADILFIEDLKTNPLKVEEIKSGKTITSERRLKRKDGTPIVMEVSTKMLEDGVFIMFGHDITERKQAEEEMKQLTSRLLIATNSAGMGVWDWDIRKNHLAWDNGMYRLYGIGNSQHVSVYEEWILRLHPDDKYRVNEEIQIAVAGKKEYDTEFRVVWNDLSIHYLKAAGIVEKDMEGNPVRMIGVNWDITGLKLSAVHLKELNENLVSHTKELAVSNGELEQFAYVASHDLQEPLRMVTSYLTQIEKKYGDIIDDKGKKYIHFAVDGAKRMRQIILDLLEFSRVGRTEDKIENIDVNKLINEVQILLRKHIEEKKAVFIVDKLPQIYAHGSPIRHVFQNLIGNALKYSKKGTPSMIQISAKELEEHWQFSVNDNGIGIEKEYFEKIFIIFQRLHNKYEFSGTGMGLAITKKIIETHGGKIWVESEEGIGSSFHFIIPKDKMNVNNIEHQFYKN